MRAGEDMLERPCRAEALAAERGFDLDDLDPGDPRLRRGGEHAGQQRKPNDAG